MSRLSIYDRALKARYAYLEVGGTMDTFERCFRVYCDGPCMDAALVFDTELQAYYAGGLFALNRLLKKFGYDPLVPSMFFERDVPLVVMAAYAWERFVGLGGECSMYDAMVFRTTPQAFFAGGLFEYNRLLYAMGSHYHPPTPYDDFDKAVVDDE